jgi:hypothetical protein
MSKGKAKSSRKAKEDQVRLFENQASSLPALRLIAASSPNEDLSEDPLANVVKDPRQDQALIQTLIDFFKKA